MPYIVIVTVGVQRRSIPGDLTCGSPFVSASARIGLYQCEAFGRDHVSQVAAYIVNKTCLRYLCAVRRLPSFANPASEAVGKYRHRSAVRVRIHSAPQRARPIHPGGYKSATLGKQNAHGAVADTVISAILRAVRMPLPCRPRAIDLRGAIGSPKFVLGVRVRQLPPTIESLSGTLERLSRWRCRHRR